MENIGVRNKLSLGNKDFIKKYAKTFDFFQLTRLLNDLDIKDLKFATDPSLSYAISDVVALEEKEEYIKLLVSFMGLIGQAGILPEHFSALILERLNQKDNGLYEFLNIFHHRLITLFYQAWANVRFYVAMESLDNVPMLDLVASLTGQGLRAENQREKNIHLFYASLFSKKNKSVNGLTILLQDYFDIPVRIEPWQGEWVNVSKNDLTFLSSSFSNNILGSGAMLGSKVWYLQNKFSIHIGIVDYSRLMILLPNKKMMKAIKCITHDYIGSNYQFKIFIHVNKETVPTHPLSKHSHIQLGWNSWLNKKNNIKTEAHIKFSMNGYDNLIKIQQSRI